MAEVRTLLAFDSAGGGCSAAVRVGGATVASRDEAMRRGQAERLVPMLQEVMAEAGLSYAGLDAIAVTVGPGGFTGVRIGLATARGLALARDLPIIGVTGFEAFAAAVPCEQRENRTLLVAIDGKRADIYAQAFAPDGTALTEPAALLPDTLDGWLPPEPLLLAGDGVAQAQPALQAAGRDTVLAEAPTRIDAAVVARIAASRPLPRVQAPPRPLYLRPPDVTPPRGAQAAR